MDAAGSLSGVIKLDEKEAGSVARWDEDDAWAKPRRRGWGAEGGDWGESDDEDDDDDWDDYDTDDDDDDLDDE